MIGGCVEKAGGQVKTKLVRWELEGARISQDSELLASLTGCKEIPVVDLVRANPELILSSGDQQVDVGDIVKMESQAKCTQSTLILLTLSRASCGLGTGLDPICMIRLKGKDHVLFVCISHLTVVLQGFVTRKPILSMSSFPFYS